MEFLEEVELVFRRDASPIRALEKLPRLHQIVICANTPANFDTITRSISKMQALRDCTLVSYTHLPRQIDWNTLRNVPLQKLSLDQIVIDFDALGQMHTLRELNISNTAIANDRIQALTQLPHLEKLYFRNTALDDEGLEAVSRIPTLKRIGICSEPRVTSIGLQHIAHIADVELDVEELSLLDTIRIQSLRRYCLGVLQSTVERIARVVRQVARILFQFISMLCAVAGIGVLFFGCFKILLTVGVYAHRTLVFPRLFPRMIA
jgi:hypothetical protein